MARYTADQNRIGFLYESGTYAVSDGSPAMQWVGLVQDHTPDEAINRNPVRYVGVGTRDFGQLVDGTEDYTGTISYYPQDFKFLALALGSNVDAGAASAYSHIMTATNNDKGNYATSGTKLPFVSFTMRDTHSSANGDGKTFSRELQGCMVNSWALSASAGDIVTVDVDYVAQGLVYSSGTSYTVTSATTKPFTWNDMKVQLPSGTNMDEVKDVSLTINNNIEVPHYVNGSKTSAIPVPLNRDYELSLTLDADDANMKVYYDQYFKGGSAFNMMLYMEDAATTGSREVSIILSGCKITDMENPSLMEGIDENTMTILPKTVNAEAYDGIELYNAW